MSTLKIIVPVAFTDTTLPILRKDAILTPGSLALFDLAHSYDPLPSGVPSSGSAVPNIAWEEAAAAVGSGTQTTLKGAFTNLFASATYAVFERSTKGALHGMISQLADATSGQRRAVIALPTLVRDYLYTNRTHSFYFSVWRRVTRAAKAGAGLEYPLFGALKNASSTSNFLAYGDRTGTFPAATGLLGTRVDPSLNSVADNFRNVGISAFTGTFTAGSEIESGFPFWGCGGTAFNGQGSQYAQSHAFYRAYVEDLTVSGRSYDQVDAIDRTLWTAAFASGGRYYGDSMSTPSIVVP